MSGRIHGLTIRIPAFRRQQRRDDLVPPLILGEFISQPFLESRLIDRGRFNRPAHEHRIPIVGPPSGVLRAFQQLIDDAGPLVAARIEQKLAHLRRRRQRAGNVQINPPQISSVINFRPGQTRANNAIVTLGPAGDVLVRTGMGSGSVQFILDVDGYFDD